MRESRSEVRPDILTPPRHDVAPGVIPQRGTPPHACQRLIFPGSNRRSGRANSCHSALVAPRPGATRRLHRPFQALSVRKLEGGPDPPPLHSLSLIVAAPRSGCDKAPPGRPPPATADTARMWMTSLLRFPMKALSSTTASRPSPFRESSSNGAPGAGNPSVSRHSISCCDGHPVTGSCGGPRIATESGGRATPSGVTWICGSEARST